jgi:hypothetical protein
MAKKLHPDIAGASAAEEFKRLTDEYEEAKAILRAGPSHADSRSTRSSASSGSNGEGAGSGAGYRQQSRPQNEQWHGPRNEYWRANPDVFAGRYRHKPMDADAQRFRERHRSHAQMDGQGGYSYQASRSGYNTNSSQRRSIEVTPAQRLRQVVYISGTILGATFLLSRLRPHAAYR